MARRRRKALAYQTVTLDGVSYAVVRRSVFDRLCAKAGVDTDAQAPAAEPDTSLSPFDTDRAMLAEKLLRRRKGAGLTQAELARRAQVRVETLNRIERGKTTPDFKTVRKLAVALEAAEKKLV